METYLPGESSLPSADVTRRKQTKKMAHAKQSERLGIIPLLLQKEKKLFEHAEKKTRVD